MRIANPTHSITLGGLDLVVNGQPAAHSGYTLEVSADGTTWGNPAVAVSSLISELSDGEIVSQQHTGNREPVLYVRIVAEDHAGLIAGDTALSAVVGQPCELVWTPPGPSAPSSVIDVVHSRMDHQWDDMDELRYVRVWVITMSALPWPRSAAKIVTPAVATAAATVVDSGAATTNWSILHPSSAPLSVVSGAVRSTYDPAVLYLGVYGTTLIRTAAIDVSVNKYIAFDWKTSLPGTHEPAFDGAYGNVEISRQPAPAAGYTRSWYRVADSLTSLSSVSFSIFHPAGSGTATLDIDQILIANQPPFSGTARQLSKSINPGGNIPAEGDVIVQHATAGLGRVIIYTHPAGGGYSPPLRPWRFSSSAVTSSADRVSGSWNLLDTITEFRVPNNAIPEGATQLWIRAGHNVAGGSVLLSWAIYPAVGTAAVGGVILQGTTLLNFPAALPSHYLFPICAVPLPVAKSGLAGITRIEIQAGDAASSLVYFDEGWLFATDRGRLTVVDCGEGAPAAGSTSNRLRVSAPSLEEPNGSIMIGTAADWSDAYAPGVSRVICDQTGHRFDPTTGSVVFTVTPGTTDASVSLEHYRRWRAEAGS